MAIGINYHLDTTKRMYSRFLFIDTALSRTKNSAFFLTFFLANPSCQSFNIDLVGTNNAPGIQNSTENIKNSGHSISRLPDTYEKRVAPFIFLSERPLEPEPAWMANCSNLRDEICHELNIPFAHRPILIYLFGEKASYDQYMKQRYPDLPSRRAFFVAQGRSKVLGEDLMVLTWWSDRIEQDLRHELTHALLHAVLADVPLWLDEGLAEFFEMENNINQFKERLEQTQADFAKGPGPNLARLEGIRSIHLMQRPEYRESWLWVRYMLCGPQEYRRLLVDYLRELRQNDNPPPLAPRFNAVSPDISSQLKSYAAQLKGPNINTIVAP